MNAILDLLHAVPPAAGVAIGLVLGFGLGLVHFTTLKHVAALYTSGAKVWRVLGLQLLRFALLALVLIVVAQLGALPLLAAAAGILVARQIVIRRNRAEAS